MPPKREAPTLKQCTRSLNALQRLFLDYPPSLKLSPDVIGMTGEIMVWKRLIENDMPFVPIGGQAGYDILLDKTSSNKIEVRTARHRQRSAKDETKIWSWSAQKWGKRREYGANYDYLICVALGDDLKIENARFFLFTQNQVMSMEEVKIPRYGKIRRRITLYELFETFLHDRKTDSNTNKDRGLGLKLVYTLNKNPSTFMKWEVLRQ